jgi:hypothetical protein
MDFTNSTSLDSNTLERMFLESADPFPTDELVVRVRYSRGSDFSGSCYYDTHRLFVNLGKHLVYPYAMDTYIARSVAARNGWVKPLYSIELADGYQVVLFVLMHEFYHWLIKRAGRNTRQKESMCDRFAARAMVDRFATPIRDSKGDPVQRLAWDFQNLDGFVARAHARPTRTVRPAARASAPPTPQSTPTLRPTKPTPPATFIGQQLMLFGQSR